MDELDKNIRKQLSQLGTPPPQTDWHPDRSWEKLQRQLASEEESRERPLSWIYYAAAAFVILLIPFVVMLSDIWKQQNQINRLASELVRERQKKMTGVEERNLMINPAPDHSEEKMPHPEATPRPVPAKDLRVVQQHKPAYPLETRQSPKNSFLEKETPQMDQVAQPEELTQVKPVPEVTKENTVNEVNAKVNSLRLVVSKPKRKATSVTFVFPGRDQAPQETPQVAQAEARTGKKGPFRILTHDKGDDSRTRSVEELPSPVTILTARK